MKKLLLMFFLVPLGALANVALHWAPVSAIPGGSGGPVEMTGTGTTIQSDADGSASITVPADAEMILLSWSGWVDGENAPISELNFDDGATFDFTTLSIAVWPDYSTDHAVYYITSNDSNWPGTGSKTLYYASPASLDEGENMRVYYAKNVDVASPVGDIDKLEGSDAVFTSNLTGVASEDMGVVSCYSYQTVANVDPATYGQTVEVEEAAYRDAGLAVGYELGESALRAEGGRKACIAFGINNG